MCNDGFWLLSQLRPVCRKSGLPRHARNGKSLLQIRFLENGIPGIKTMASLPVPQFLAPHWEPTILEHLFPNSRSHAQPCTSPPHISAQLPLAQPCTAMHKSSTHLRAAMHKSSAQPPPQPPQAPHPTRLLEVFPELLWEHFALV